MDAFTVDIDQPSTMEAEPYFADYRGFEELYRLEYPRLYAVASGLVSPDRCDDVVQDTMYRALLHWRRVRLTDRPGAWCHRVLINGCRAVWRRRQVERRFADRYPQRPQSTAGPSADIVAFWSAVRELPSRPRIVVSLYFGADRSTAEIASILDVPEGTVRSDLTRARQVLAAQLRG